MADNDLRPIAITLEQDDPLTVTAANRAPITSTAYQSKWEAEHRADGTHKNPIAQAMAIVNWNGVAPVLVATDGVSLVSNLSTGRWRVILTFNMASSAEWIVDVQTGGTEPGGCVEIYSTKALDRVEFETRNTAGTLFNTDFVIYVFGERA